MNDDRFYPLLKSIAVNLQSLILRKNIKYDV